MVIALICAATSSPSTANATILALCFLILPLAVDRERPSSYGKGVGGLLIGLGSLFLLQLLPLGLVTNLGDHLAELPGQLALTKDWGRTFGSLLFVGAMVSVFVVFGRFSENDFNRLLPFFFLGFILNLVVALVQFTASGTVDLPFLAYAPSAGFFSNGNHFASLLFVAVPFVVYQFAAIKRPFLSLVALGLLIFVGFATRSVAGAFLTLGCAMVSFALVVNVRRVVRYVLLISVLIGAIVLATNPGNVLDVAFDSPLDRTTIWSHTMTAAIQYMPLGSGVGTFELIYPQFEAPGDVRTVYINHAHNEYLELVLEGGVPAAILLLAYFLLIGVTFALLPRTSLRIAAYCGLGFLLIHSFVDYPARTPAISLVFVMLNAIVFSTNLHPRAAASGRIRGVSANKTAPSVNIE